MLVYHVLQSIILLLGGVISVAALVSRVPGGPTAVVQEGHQYHKLSLGKTEWSWQERTVPTVLSYATVHYMTKFITFQDAVQRYLAVPSHKVVACTMLCFARSAEQFCVLLCSPHFAVHTQRVQSAALDCHCQPSASQPRADMGMT